MAFGTLLAVVVPALAETPLPRRSDQSIYDVANVLDVDSKASVEAQSLELYDKAGVSIVVLTVPALEDETIAGSWWR